MPKRSSRKKKGLFKRSKSKNRTGIDLMIDVLFPVAYGAGREFINDKLDPITSKVPLGVIADEAVLGTLAFIGHKKLKNPMAKKSLKNVLIIECASVGQTIKDFGLKKALTGKD